eukprot:2031870-Amphidinium_carterae.1
MDMKTWVLDRLLKKLLPFASEAAFVFIEQSGCGKTPLANALALAMSGHYIQQMGLEGVPSFRSSNNLDFFRGEPGEVQIPFVWDDGDVCKEESEAVKGFLDLTGIDPKVKDRWGASSFTRLQPRIMCCNKYAEKVEPQVAPDGQISFK